MKLCIQTYTMARQRSGDKPFEVAGLCAFTRRMKIEAIDWCGVYGVDPAEVRRITDDHGIKNVCYTFHADLNFPTPQERAPGREAFQQGVEVAKILGANMIMLPVSGKEALGREASFGNYVAGLREVMDVAKQAGVTVTVEHFPARWSPFISSDDVNRAVAEVPDLRICFDNGNVTTAGENAGEAFRRSAGHIVHAHFKDWKECEPDAPNARLFLDGKSRFATLVGDGDVDQTGSLRAMRDCGFEGYINFEYEGSELTPREATAVGVRRIRGWMRQLDIPVE